MATEGQLLVTEYLMTINRFPGDGVTEVFDINFAGGYISRSHIKGYVMDADTREVTREFTPAPGDWVGPNQIRVLPVVEADEILVLYRDTPKDTPLVDFVDGAILNEANLDTNAKQAVFVSAEMADRFGITAETASTAAEVATEAREAAAAAAAAATTLATRAIRAPLAEVLTETLPSRGVRAGKFIAFDDAGEPTVGVPTSDSATALANSLAQSEGAFLVGDAVARVDNIAALRALPAPSRKTVVQVEGYYTPGDRGGGAFLWVPASTKADDGGTVIAPVPAPANGRWERGIWDVVDVKMFGATGNLADDQTPAFKALRDYLNTQRLGPSSGALENSVAGIRVVAPRGIYRLTEQVVFGPYLSIEFDFQHAEIYYNGPALPDNEGALVFHNLSWVSLKNVYHYAPLEFRSCYRVHTECVKVQGRMFVNDCWNYKALSNWYYYGRTLIRGGHQHNYDNCAFEFGANNDYKIVLENPDSVTFSNIYTEWLHYFLNIRVTSAYTQFRGVLFENSFIDVQTKSSVNSNGQPLMRFENTSGVPVVAPIIFRSCNFNSVGAVPAFNAEGIWITADDTYTDIIIDDTWTVQNNSPVSFGTLLAASAISFSRIFKGAGIRVKGWEPPDTGCKIDNGRFTYPAIPNGNANTSDQYREGNIGWVYNGTISGGTNGGGAISMTTGGAISRDMPVANAGRRLTHRALRPGYYWLVVAHKNGSFQVDATLMKGSGASKAAASVGGSPSAIVTGYPTSGITMTSTVTYTKVLLHVPRFDDDSEEITWLRITLTANHATFATTWYGAALHPAGSFPRSQFEDGREEMATDAIPTWPGNWIGQTVRRRIWDAASSPTIGWAWTASGAWAQVLSE